MRALEAFRETVDPDAVYTERELVALHVDTYPPVSSPALDRKVARMEASLVEVPRSSAHGSTRNSSRGSLRMASRPRRTARADPRARRLRRYRAVPRLGAIGAQRITDFIAQHPDTQRYLSPLAVTPRRQLASGSPALQPVPGAGADVMPLEALRVPAALDGSARLNRAPVPAYQTELATDLQAVPVWNAIRGAYRRETERLLPWAIAAKGKRLPSLNTPHRAEYLDQFLRDPQPAERRIGCSRVERFDPAWQPFVGPLSECSRDTRGESSMR
ncbi:phage integrase family protein [Burkholderia ubonensis]|uniref:phage integrase family protein n=1 Tax=Burkholderia ubonensis TaxID=101571 RepID=UPI000AEE1DEA|nr:phage integrase family protein [Burkholderia ubonensis]